MCFLISNCLYEFFFIVRFSYRDLVWEINSNRFSRLMHQNLVRIFKTSALTFILSTGTFDLILYSNSM